MDAERARGADFLSSEVRFRAARPPTFFVLPKKVGKETRAHEDGRCGGSPALLARAGGHRNSHDLAPAARATCFGQSMAQCPDSYCAARRFRGPPRQRLAPLPWPLAPSGRGACFSALKDAEQRRTSRSCRASTVRSTWLGVQRRDRASFDARRRVRVAKAPPKAASLQARLSLVTFFGKTKKVGGRAALKRTSRRKTIRPAHSATAPAC